MRISIELSFYPLAEEFKPPIKEVINKLQSYPAVEVHANRMSTQLFGEFKAVTTALNTTMQWSFEQFGQAVFVAKIMNADRSPKNV